MRTSLGCKKLIEKVNDEDKEPRVLNILAVQRPELTIGSNRLAIRVKVL
jgi:hypothetical protein